jgi:hypothetical protein
MIYHPRWITKKIFHIFSDSIDYEILDQDRMRFEKKSNLSQMIHEYYVENKHDLTW